MIKMLIELFKNKDDIKKLIKVVNNQGNSNRNNIIYKQYVYWITNRSIKHCEKGYEKLFNKMKGVGKVKVKFSHNTEFDISKNQLTIKRILIVVKVAKGANNIDVRNRLIDIASNMMSIPDIEIIVEEMK